MKVNGYEISHYANLKGVDLKGANLMCANLMRANLRGADLRGANLIYANLKGADLRGANLNGAILRGAILNDAILNDAILNGVVLSDFQITPKGYPLIGFKKLRDNTICTLKIPAEAERTASLVGRKCRAEYAEVLEGSGACGSLYNGVLYETGAVVHPDKYDPDIRVECTHGIHFYLTPEEARISDGIL